MAYKKDTVTCCKSERSIHSPPKLHVLSTISANKKTKHFRFNMNFFNSYCNFLNLVRLEKEEEKL